jgi:pimeloyl-ACP methyl ester carboxylesterase
MDSAGSRRAALVGFSAGAAMSVMFAAAYPERVSHLIIFGSSAAGPAHRNPAYVERIAQRAASWGDGTFLKQVVSPHASISAQAMQNFGKLERLTATPSALRAQLLPNAQIDVRPILGSVQAPCRVIYRRTEAQRVFDNCRMAWGPGLQLDRHRSRNQQQLEAGRCGAGGEPLPVPKMPRPLYYPGRQVCWRRLEVLRSCALQP